MVRPPEPAWVVVIEVGPVVVVAVPDRKAAAQRAIFIDGLLALIQFSESRVPRLMERPESHRADGADAATDGLGAHDRTVHVTDGSDVDEQGRGDLEDGSDDLDNDDASEDSPEPPSTALVPHKPSRRIHSETSDREASEGSRFERESRPYRRHTGEEQQPRRRSSGSDDSRGNARRQPYLRRWDRVGRSPPPPERGQSFASGRVRWDDEDLSPPPPPPPRLGSYNGTHYPSPPRRRSSSRYRDERYAGTYISPPPDLPVERTIIRERRPGYMPPVSADTDDEEAPLAETVTLKFDGKENGTTANLPQAGSDGMHQAWYQSQASFGNGVDTELVVINAAESFTDERGNSSVTLYCQKDPLGQEKSPPSQMYWL